MYVAELRALLYFANLFHHDSNPAWSTQIINDQALVNFAQRTLAFTRRLARRHSLPLSYAHILTPPLTRQLYQIIFGR